MPGRTLRRAIHAATGAIVLAAGLGGAGLASASSRPAVAGTEHFQLMSTSATATREAIIAYGLFTAHGVDLHGAKVDTIKFANGTFKIAHSPGTGPSRFDPATCLFVSNQHGTYTIGHGTGAYRGITGTGKYQLSIVGVGAKSGGTCTRRKPPVAFQLIIRASGPARR